MQHSSGDFFLTLVALVGGGFLWVHSPDSHTFVMPIVSAFVGSWLRSQMPTNGNGNGNAKPPA